MTMTADGLHDEGDDVDDECDDHDVHSVESEGAVMVINHFQPPPVRAAVLPEGDENIFLLFGSLCFGEGLLNGVGNPGTGTLKDITKYQEPWGPSKKKRENNMTGSLNIGRLASIIESICWRVTNLMTVRNIWIL